MSYNLGNLSNNELKEPDTFVYVGLEYPFSLIHPHAVRQSSLF